MIVRAWMTSPGAARLAPRRIRVGTGIARDKGRSRLLFVLQLHRVGAEPDLLEVEPEALGAPPEGWTLESLERFRDFRAPEEIAGPLRELAGAAGRPIWLEIGTSEMLAPAIPWEHLLSPLVERPLLRLSPDSLPGQVRDGELHLAFCSSVPVAKADIGFEYVQEAVRTVRDMYPAGTRVSVFTDAERVGMLRDMLVTGARDSCVRVHDPALAGPFEAPRRSLGVLTAPGDFQNPWLQWMESTLRDDPPAAVLFLAHGFLAAGQGALALAETPTRNQDRRAARFVGPAEIDAFADRVGAWALGVTQPPENYSPGGSRLFAHQLAALRPGPVLMHDAWQDHTAHPSAYLQLLRRLLTGEEDELPVSGQLTAYCDPQSISRRPAAARGLESLLEAFQPPADRETGASPMPEAVLSAAGGIREAEEPEWLGLARRHLERLAARGLDAARGDRPASGGLAGAQDAAAIFAAIVSRHNAAAGTRPGEPLQTPEVAGQTDVSPGTEAMDV